jgi:hypothetical protein
MKDVIDALSGTKTAFASCEISRHDIDLIRDVLKMLKRTTREVVCDDDVTVLLKEAVDEVAADESGTTRD